MHLRKISMLAMLLAFAMLAAACGNSDTATTEVSLQDTSGGETVLGRQGVFDKGEEETAPDDTTTTTIAEPIEIEDVSLRLDWLKGGGYHTGFYVALEKGFFEEAGFNVSIGDGQGSTSTVQLLAAGEDEFGYVAGTALVAAIAEGMPVIEVANMIPYTGLCTATLATSGLDTMASLNGRTWGGTAYGSSTAIIDVILEAGGADPEQVQKVTLDTAALSVAFMEGTIDAFDVVRFSDAMEFEAAGVHINMFCHDQLGLDGIGWGLVVNTDDLASDPDRIARFVAAAVKGYEWAYANKEEAGQIAFDFNEQLIEPAAMIALELAEIEAVWDVQSQARYSQTDENWATTIDIVNLVRSSTGDDPVEASAADVYTNDLLP